MKAAAEDEPPAPDLRPVERLEPLLPVQIPPADWRAEEVERNHKPRPLDEPTKSLQRWPA
jgi:hypothetical protein